MKNTNIKAIIMIIALFLVLSVTAGIFFAARETNAPAIDENPDGTVSFENSGVSDDGNNTEEDISEDDKADEVPLIPETQPDSTVQPAPTTAAKAPPKITATKAIAAALSPSSSSP